MKKPAVIIQFRGGLVSSVRSVADSSQVPSGTSAKSLEDQPNGVGGGSSESKRRSAARIKQPTLPLLPSQLPSFKEDLVNTSLAILETRGTPVARYLQHDEEIPGIRIPKRSPRDSSFITMVEWALRPGDSRVEAYFVGTNKRSKYWFLIERTVNDLEPYTTRYLSTRTTAMVEKGRLEIEKAALLLLECAWQFEKENWSTPCFFMISDDGLLDNDTVWELANDVWPEEDTDEQNVSKPDPIVAYGAGYIIKRDTIELQDNVSMEEFADAFPFFKATEWGLICAGIEGVCDGFGYKFIDYKIKARIGKYLKSWQSYAFITYVHDNPRFPDWLDAEYDADSKCYYLYGIRSDAKD